MACQDCIRFEVCDRKWRNNDGVMKMRDSEECKYFIDRSHYIEQKHGFWLYEEDCYGDPIYQCSNCGVYFILVEGTPEENEYDYCPSCGAKMDELEEKERVREHE